MKKQLNKSKALCLSFSVVTILLLSLVPLASAQETATVITSTSDSVGGTTSPVPGTYTYDQDSIIRIEAKPNEGYVFLHWVIIGGYTPGHNEPPLIVPNDEVIQPPSRPPTLSTYDSLIVEQNPLFVECGFGYTYEYQAVFVSVAPERDEAVVVVKESVGGTVDPGAGTYTFGDGSSVVLTATPSSGYEFMAWLASGSGLVGHEELLIMDNPLDVMCGLGYTYEYLPIFTETGTSTDSDGVPDEYFYAAIIILAIIAVVAISAALMYRNKK